MSKLRIVFSIVCLLTLAMPVWAQAPTGSVSGTVTDEQGAVIPDAKIIVTNRETGAAREINSAGNGSYSLPSLAAGTYSIQVEAKGFEGRRRAATVAVGSATRVDFLLKVGAQTTIVQVEDAAPQINYETHSVDGVVTRTQIQDLPLNGRSFLNLASIE